MKKSKVLLNSNDKCMVCETCIHEQDIYNCTELNRMVNEKKLEYVWCWIEK